MFILHIHVLSEPLIKDSINYSYLQKTIDFEINNGPASHDTILDACKSVMDYSIKTGSEKENYIPHGFLKMINYNGIMLIGI